MVDTDRLRELMAARGLTQKQAAAALGMTGRSFYNRLKAGIFTTVQAERLSELLGIADPAEVFFAKTKR